MIFLLDIFFCNLLHLFAIEDSIAEMEIQKMIEELKATRLTQKQIAELTLLSTSYISDLLSGKRGKNIAFDKYERIAALHQTRTRRNK